MLNSTPGNYYLTFRAKKLSQDFASSTKLLLEYESVKTFGMRIVNYYIAVLTEWRC